MVLGRNRLPTVRRFFSRFYGRTRRGIGGRRSGPGLGRGRPFPSRSSASLRPFPHSPLRFPTLPGASRCGRLRASHRVSSNPTEPHRAPVSLIVSQRLPAPSKNSERSRRSKRSETPQPPELQGLRRKMAASTVDGEPALRMLRTFRARCPELPHILQLQHLSAAFATPAASSFRVPSA